MSSQKTKVIFQAKFFSIELDPSSQNGGEVIYFKNSINTTNLIDGMPTSEEDLFPPHWVGLEATALKHPYLNGKKVHVQDLKGDVISRP